MSAPAMQASARQPDERTANEGQYDPGVGSNIVRVACCRFSTPPSRCDGVMQTFPRSLGGRTLGYPVMRLEYFLRSIGA